MKGYFSIRKQYYDMLTGIYSVEVELPYGMIGAARHRNKDIAIANAIYYAYYPMTAINRYN